MTYFLNLKSSMYLQLVTAMLRFRVRKRQSDMTDVDEERERSEEESLQQVTRSFLSFAAGILTK